MSEIERIAAGDKPAWWLCKRSSDPRFTAGVAYEAFRYDGQGRAVIPTDAPRGSATLPVKRAEFVPHDPWASSRAHLQEQTP